MVSATFSAAVGLGGINPFRGVINHSEQAVLLDGAGLFFKLLAREGSAGRVTAGIAADIPVLAEATILERLLSNPVRSALRYAPTGAITLSDEGPEFRWLPSRVSANRFCLYAARTNEPGGTGLNLVIVQDGIAPCRGPLSFRNRTPNGCEAEISLSRA